MSAKGLSQITLVIDIAPGIIKGAVIGMPKGGAPHILIEREQYFEYNERMMAAFGELLREILKQSPNIYKNFLTQPEQTNLSK